jgi:hypothetical protein
LLRTSLDQHFEQLKRVAGAAAQHG